MVGSLCGVLCWTLLWLSFCWYVMAFSWCILSICCELSLSLIVALCCCECSCLSAQTGSKESATSTNVQQKLELFFLRNEWLAVYIILWTEQGYYSQAGYSRDKEVIMCCYMLVVARLWLVHGKQQNLNCLTVAVDWIDLKYLSSW